LAACLGGCSGQDRLANLNPVDWWHGLEGGAIAQTRPPPPNADAPYPSLGSIPAKPPPPDAAAHAQIANALVADRSNAKYTQTALPIPAVTPAQIRAQAAQSADAEQPNATLASASAPPPPPAVAPPPKKAPVAPVSATPLPAPAAPPSPPQAPAEPAPPAAAAALEPAAAAPVLADAPVPDIPAAPPPPPQLSGVATPPAVTAPTASPVAPPAPPAAPPVVDGKPIPIPFAAGSAVLQADALVPIKLLAKRRGPASIAVTGFGEATSSDTAAQSAALPLALDRARAVASQLMADGVPNTAIRIAAEPQGSGAAARLVN
jgi:outer membrane protein OmpA-like peptidoglycan-associated protein